MKEKEWPVKSNSDRHSETLEGRDGGQEAADCMGIMGKKEWSASMGVLEHHCPLEPSVMWSVFYSCADQYSDP